MERDNYFDGIGPELVLEVFDPYVDMRGILIIDNSALGSVSLGGLSLNSKLRVREELFRLARTTTIKNALYDIPFGGAKAEICSKNHNLSKEDKIKLIRHFAKAIKNYVPKKYIAIPDLNIGQEEMRVFAETIGSWKACTGKPSTFATIKGKKRGLPIELGGFGYGIAHAASSVMNILNFSISGAKVLIDGFEEVGSSVAATLENLGAIVVGIREENEIIYNKNGIPISSLIKLRSRGESILKCNDVSRISLSSLKEFEIDLLILTSQYFTLKELYSSTKAKVIVEGSNTLNLEEANKDENLKKDKIVVPNVVACGGDVISAYAELQGLTIKEMFNLIEKRVKDVSEKIMAASVKNGVSPRSFAMEVAINRIMEAARRRNRIY